jgi:hypothetical protein
MAYNLPPAWDPGFVLPENVKDEGLERRAFVTKWMPRGTYDQPCVGTAGYAVPQYVKDEGYGQGTYTTKWQPSGTYNGPKVPHWLNDRPKVVRSQAIPGGRVFTVEPLGDDPMPEPFETYGQKGAQGILARLATLPSSQRQKTLKKTLDLIDKSLWPRTQEIFQRYLRQGMAPPDAVRMALARALSTGIAAEIIDTGLRRTAPQANSLLGLGCYGCLPLLGAMGEDPPECQYAAGYSWVYGTGTLPGHWARTAKDAKDVPFCPGGPPKGAVTVKEEDVIVREHRDPETFFVGPFPFAPSTLKSREWVTVRDGGTYGAGQTGRFASPDLMYVSPDPNAPFTPQPLGSPVRPITKDVIDWLRDRLREEKDAAGRGDIGVTYVDRTDERKAASFAPEEPDAKAWFSAMGITPTTPIRLHTLWYLRTTIAPFGRTKHPKTGEDMVMHVSLAPLDGRRGWDEKTNRLALKVWLSRVPDVSIWGAFWDPMILINPVTLLKASAQATAGIVKYMADLSCDVLNDPQGKAAAEAGASALAAYYGLPPEAGADGVNFAASKCGQPPPPVKPPPPPAHSILPAVLLAGGAAVAAYLILRKPKKKAH